MDFIVNDFKFNKIDIKAFERIWDSAHYDNHIDSWEFPFSETKEEEWKPVFERASVVWREVTLSDVKIGYVFISPKTDGTAHLGYGIYKEHRGKGLSVPICKHYLEENISKLNKDITYLVGTTLKDNSASIKVLERLGFEYFQEVVETHNGIEIPYTQYRMKL
jgi:RimJ/RimL family protein N-acetyltransferase